MLTSTQPPPNVEGAHPSRERLTDFGLGRLNESDLALIEEHVSTCVACCRTLQELPNDHLITVLQEMEKSEALPPPARRGDGQHGDESGDRFLAPPHGPGEMGWLGPYRVLRVLGRGGMAVVFEAQDPQLERKVALKVMQPSVAARAEARQRFLREARNTAAIEHDHIVTIHQVGEDRGIPYLAMQLLQGETLESRLQREPRLPVAEILRIGRETAKGLAAAHARGLIHRDIKPANIWLENGAGRVKILDLGLACAADDERHITQTGIVAGTPAYMAPEQASDALIDHRCDLFSLGCVLYRLCTGELPFKGTRTLTILRALAVSQPTAPRDLNPEAPPALSDLIMRLLAKDPAQRPKSADEVADALTGCLAQREREPASLPKPDPAARRPRRNRGWQTLVAAGLLAAAMLLAAQIIIKIKDKEGRTKEIKVTEGSSVTIEEGGKVLAQLPLGDGKVGPVHCFIGHKGRVWCVAFASSGRDVISAGADRSVRVWDVIAGKEKEHLRFEGHRNCVYAVTVDPKGVWAISGDGAQAHTEPGDWKVCMWEIASGRVLHELSGHGTAITCVAVTRDGRQGLFGHYDGTVVLYDLEKWIEVRRFHTDPGLWSVAFSPDGGQMLTGGGYMDRGHLRLWNLGTGNEEVHFDGHENGIWRAVFTPDGKQVISVSSDHTIRAWDALKATELYRLRHDEVAAGLAVSADGKRAVTSGYDKVVRLWDLEQRKQQHRFDGHTWGVQSVALSPDGKFAASGGFDGTVRLWRLPP